MHPTGGQGVQGCAPIPGAGGGVSQQSPSPAPKPLGEWVRTWGGVAVSPTTSDAGDSTGREWQIRNWHRANAGACGRNGAGNLPERSASGVCRDLPEVHGTDFQEVLIELQVRCGSGPGECLSDVQKCEDLEQKDH